MSESPILCILCNPRSGSNAIRMAFAANAQVMDCGEIFHDRREYTDTRFLDFLQQWPRPIQALVDHQEAMQLARAFLDQLRSEAHGRSVLIDIKHNSWGLLRPLWKFPHETPLFLNLLKDQEARIILLRRRDLADQVISYHLAIETEYWDRTLTTENLPPNMARHQLAPDLARRLCSLFLRAEALVAEFVGPYFHQLALDYEDTFAGDQLTREAADQLERFTGLELDRGPLPLRRNRVDKRELISNYQQVREIAEQVRSEFRERGALVAADL